jgi:hypothetical protein
MAAADRGIIKPGRRGRDEVDAYRVDSALDDVVDVLEANETGEIRGSAAESLSVNVESRDGVQILRSGREAAEE